MCSLAGTIPAIRKPSCKWSINVSAGRVGDENNTADELRISLHYITLHMGCSTSWYHFNRFTLIQISTTFLQLLLSGPRLAIIIIRPKKKKSRFFSFEWKKRRCFRHGQHGLVGSQANAKNIVHTRSYPLMLIKGNMATLDWSWQSRRLEKMILQPKRTTRDKNLSSLIWYCANLHQTKSCWL